MKFDKYLQGVIFLVITITSVSIVLISNFISTYEEQQEMELFVKDYSMLRVNEILKEINDAGETMEIISNDQNIIEILLVKDTPAGDYNLVFDRIESYLSELMLIEELHDVIIFVNGERLISVSGYEYIPSNDIDLTQKYQIFDQGSILSINVEKILPDGTRINTIALKNANVLFYDRIEKANSIFISGELDGQAFGTTPANSFKTFTFTERVFPYNDLQDSFIFQFHQINQEEFSYYDSYPLLLSIAIPVTFAPLIASIVARKFSSNIETLLKISKREKEYQKISFDELISVADEIQEDRFDLSVNNAALNEQLNKLNELATEKEIFNGAISHSMKTSLVTIQGYTEMMLETETNPQQRKILENIVDSTQKLKMQISNILEASKMEEKEIIVNKESMDLDTIKKLITNSFSKMFEFNKIDFKIVSKMENLSFETNNTMLIQILSNLFTNAIEFSNKDGRVILEIIDDDSKIYFIVSDNGKGMKKEFQKDLFSKYSSSSYALNRMYGGAGLGLYISKKLAKHLGGDLVLTSSAENKGSTFTLELPKS